MKQSADRENKYKKVMKLFWFNSLKSQNSATAINKILEMLFTGVLLLGSVMNLAAFVFCLFLYRALNTAILTAIVSRLDALKPKCSG